MNNLERVAGLFLGIGMVLCCSFTAVAQEVVNEQEADEIEILDDTTTLVTPVDLVPEIEENIGVISTAVLSERFQELEKAIPLRYHEESHKYVEYFVYRKADFTRRMLENKNVYFPVYEKILAEHGMPDELKYLSLIESGLDPRVISRAGAGGLWQFMRATGREFGLKQDRFIDERFDPVKSTEAACRYLKQLYTIFGDWEMALASYNCGPGNIRRAIRRTGKDTFWGVYHALPKETRNYVPQFVAMVYLMEYADDHGIAPQQVKYAPVTDTLHINGYLNLHTFASLLGMSLEDIQTYNPQILHSSLPAYTRDFVLRVPSVKYAMVTENITAIRDSASRMGASEVLLAGRDADMEIRRVSHTVRGGESLSSIAHKYRVSVTDLKRWNRLHKNTILKGQRLVIERKVKLPAAPPVVKAKEEVLAKAVESLPDTAVTVQLAVAVTEETNDLRDHAVKIPDTLGKVQIEGTVAQGDEPKKQKAAATDQVITHTIKRGETLVSIARKYGVEVAALREVNGMSSTKLYAGKKLTIRKEVPENTEIAVKPKTPGKTVKPYYYVVQEGDTLWAISQRYGLTVDKIKKVNNIKGNALRAGMRILISG